MIAAGLIALGYGVLIWNFGAWGLAVGVVHIVVMLACAKG